MGKPRSPNSSIPCRYECGALFGSKNGRMYHERKEHGEIYPRRDKSRDIIVPINEKSNFVEINEVKLMTEKKPKETKKDEDTCGGCQKSIPLGSKYCPECGCEFE